MKWLFSKSERKYTVMLFVITVFFLFFILMFSSSRGLLDHEIGAVNFASSPEGGFYSGEANGIFYHVVLLKPFIALFGCSSLAARMPSIICIVLSFFLLYGLARRIAGSQAALCSVFFFAINGGVLFIGKYCRFYACDCLMCLISTYLLLWLLDPKTPEQYTKKQITLGQVAYAISTMLCLTSMVSSALLFAAHWLYYLIYARDKKRAVFSIVGLSVLLLFTFKLMVLFDPVAQERIAIYAQVTQRYCLEIFCLFMGLHREAIYENNPLLQWNSYYLWTVPFIAFVYGFIYLAKGALLDRKPQVLLPLLWAVIPPVVMVFVSLNYQRILNWENCSFTLPAYAIILGVGLAKINYYLRILVLVGLIASAPLTVVPYYYYGGVGRLPKLKFIADHRHSYDQILVADCNKFFFGLNSDKYRAIPLPRDKKPLEPLLDDKLEGAIVQTISESRNGQILWMFYTMQVEDRVRLTVGRNVAFRKSWRWNWGDNHYIHAWFIAK